MEEVKERKKLKLLHLKRREKGGKGVYILPTALTLGNMFLGFMAIMMVFNHFGRPNFNQYLHKACLLILIAALFDFLDGRVARLMKATSPFGGELDSLADVISFGLAPCILAYTWALAPLRRTGWLPAALFLLTGAIRLARFNVQKDTMDKKYFIGLPIPSAALTIISLIILIPDLEPGTIYSYLIVALIYLLSFLMVSKFKYRSFKDIDVKRFKPVKTGFIVTLFFIIVMHSPELIFSIMMVGYVISGIIGNFNIKIPFIKRVFQAIVEKIYDIEEEYVEQPYQEKTGVVKIIKPLDVKEDKISDISENEDKGLGNLS